jgi:lipopolysaccharide transport system ATP-binding protein
VVSHNLRHIERLCSRVVMLSKGRIVGDGDASAVCRQFFDRSNEKIKQDSDRKSHRYATMTDELQFGSLELMDEHDHPTDRLPFLRPCKLRISFEVLRPLKRISFLVGAHTTDFVYLTANNTLKNVVDLHPGQHVAELHISSMTLFPGVYSFRLHIATPEGKAYFYAENLRPFQVVSDALLLSEHHQRGIFFMEGRWVLPGQEVPAIASPARACA